MKTRDIADINKIIIHCSDSGWGDAEEIDLWHKDRDWDCIGYNFVLLNGYAKSSDEYKASYDGKIEDGRPVEYVPAHCRGHNQDSIGICLIGIDEFTPSQLSTLLNLLEDLCIDYDIEPDDIYGHYEFSDKLCPNTDIEPIRDIMKGRLE
jgi:hypothetical protein